MFLRRREWAPILCQWFYLKSAAQKLEASGQVADQKPSETHRNPNLWSWCASWDVLFFWCCARTLMSPQTAVQLEIWKDLQSTLRMMYMLQQWRWWMGLILRSLADCIMHMGQRPCLSVFVEILLWYCLAAYHIYLGDIYVSERWWIWSMGNKHRTPQQGPPITLDSNHQSAALQGWETNSSAICPKPSTWDLQRRRGWKRQVA